MTPIRKTSAILAVVALGVLPAAACTKKSDAPATGNAPAASAPAAATSGGQAAR